MANPRAMHELSIVMGIVEVADREAARAGVEYFDEIELEIGTQAGVVMEALDFAWGSAVKGSSLERAERKIITVEAMARCLDCGCEYKTESLYEICPECGSYATSLIKGKELKIKSLSYND